MNKKENILAIKSAIAATSNINLVRSRGHKIDVDIPIILDDRVEGLRKTKQVRLVLEKIVAADLERCKEAKVRAGKGKMRGRKYKKKKGALVIVSKDCELLRAARNIAGVDAVRCEDLNAELLAPGAQAGRLTIFTKAALEKLDKMFVK